MKDAARLAREKSQDKELANTALTIAAPQVSWTLDKEHVTLKVEQNSTGVRQDEQMFVMSHISQQVQRRLSDVLFDILGQDKVG